MLLDGDLDDGGGSMERASRRAVYQALRVPEEYHAKAGLGEQKRERESGLLQQEWRADWWSCSASESRYDGVVEVFWRFRYAGQARSAVQPA